MADYYPDEYERSNFSLIDTPYTPPQPLSGGCRGAQYCGHPAVILNGGAIIVPSGANAVELLGSWTKDLKECAGDLAFKEATPYDIGLNKDLRTLIEFHTARCQAIRHQLAQRIPIHNGDLIYLSQILPGWGSGYLLDDDGRLLQQEVRFERVHSVQVKCPDITNCTMTFLKPGAEGVYRVDNKCRMPPLELRNLGSICLWLNGITLTRSALLYPHDYFSSLLSTEYTEALSSGIEYIPDDQKTDVDTDITDDVESGESTTTYTTLWDKIRYYLIIASGTLASFIFLWGITKILARCGLCGRGKRGQDNIINIQIPMTDIRGKKDSADQDPGKADAGTGAEKTRDTNRISDFFEGL